MISIRSLVAMGAIFISWSIIDYITHFVILSPAYGETASMWRPLEEMKETLIYSVVAFTTFVFVYIFSRFFADKGVLAGLTYGILFGLSSGFSMGYGTFAVQPLPHDIALTWFIGTTVEGAVAGLLVGVIVTPRPGDKVTEDEVEEAEEAIT